MLFARWVTDAIEQFRMADPDIPSEITNDRARDNWRPLTAIADAAGVNWPQLARTIALAIASENPEPDSHRMMLLVDLKTIFNERGERIPSDEIVQALIEIEGRPWAEYRNSKPITKTGLARLLAPFGIRPKKWRDGEDTARGYEQGDFDEAFDRYLETETPQM